MCLDDEAQLVLFTALDTIEYVQPFQSSRSSLIMAQRYQTARKIRHFTHHRSPLLHPKAGKQNCTTAHHAARPPVPYPPPHSSHPTPLYAGPNRANGRDRRAARSNKQKTLGAARGRSTKSRQPRSGILDQRQRRERRNGNRRMSGYRGNHALCRWRCVCVRPCLLLSTCPNKQN